MLPHRHVHLQPRLQRHCSRHAHLMYPSRHHHYVHPMALSSLYSHDLLRNCNNVDVLAWSQTTTDFLRLCTTLLALFVSATRWQTAQQRGRRLCEVLRRTRPTGYVGGSAFQKDKPCNQQPCVHRRANRCATSLWTKPTRSKFPIRMQWTPNGRRRLVRAAAKICRHGFSTAPTSHSSPMVGTTEEVAVHPRPRPAASSTSQRMVGTTS